MSKKAHISQYHLNKLHPEKLQFEVYDLKGYRNKNIEKASQPHSHSYYQIIWFFNKAGTHMVDFKTYEIEANTILFISKDQIHAFDEHLNIEGWLIHFNESFFMHSDIDIFLKYNIFKSQKNPCYTIDNNTCKAAETYIHLIRDELSKRHQFGYEEVIRFLLKSFLICLERVHRKDQKRSLGVNSLHELQFYKFKELIEMHYARGLTIKAYADLLHISTKTLTTITRNIAQKSPSELLADRIIIEAKRLLRFTVLQINEIAFKVGFNDASYFVKYFKRHIGLSPSRFREKGN